MARLGVWRVSAREDRELQVNEGAALACGSGVHWRTLVQWELYFVSRGLLPVLNEYSGVRVDWGVGPAYIPVGFASRGWEIP